jgi:hypothetical protein
MAKLTESELETYERCVAGAGHITVGEDDFKCLLAMAKRDLSERIFLKLCSVCKAERERQVRDSRRLLDRIRDGTLSEIAAWTCPECSAKCAQALRLLLSEGWVGWERT